MTSSTPSRRTAAKERPSLLPASPSVARRSLSSCHVIVRKRSPPPALLRKWSPLLLFFVLWVVALFQTGFIGLVSGMGLKGSYVPNTPFPDDRLLVALENNSAAELKSDKAVVKSWEDDNGDDDENASVSIANNAESPSAIEANETAVGEESRERISAAGEEEKGTAPERSEGDGDAAVRSASDANDRADVPENDSNITRNEIGEGVTRGGNARREENEEEGEKQSERVVAKSREDDEENASVPTANDAESPSAVRSTEAVVENDGGGQLASGDGIKGSISQWPDDDDDDDDDEDDDDDDDSVRSASNGNQGAVDADHDSGTVRNESEGIAPEEKAGEGGDGKEDGERFSVEMKEEPASGWPDDDDDDDDDEKSISTAGNAESPASIQANQAKTTSEKESGEQVSMVPGGEDEKGSTQEWPDDDDDDDDGDDDDDDDDSVQGRSHVQNDAVVVDDNSNKGKKKSGVKHQVLSTLEKGGRIVKGSTTTNSEFPDDDVAFENNDVAVADISSNGYGDRGIAREEKEVAYQEYDREEGGGEEQVSSTEGKEENPPSEWPDDDDDDDDEVVPNSSIANDDAATDNIANISPEGKELGQTTNEESGGGVSDSSSTAIGVSNGLASEGMEPNDGLDADGGNDIGEEESTAAVEDSKSEMGSLLPSRGDGVPPTAFHRNQSSEGEEEGAATVGDEGQNEESVVGGVEEGGTAEEIGTPQEAAGGLDDAANGGGEITPPEENVGTDMDAENIVDPNNMAGGDDPNAMAGGNTDNAIDPNLVLIPVNEIPNPTNQWDGEDDEDDFFGMVMATINVLFLAACITSVLVFRKRVLDRIQADSSLGVPGAIKDEVVDVCMRSAAWLAERGSGGGAGNASSSGGNSANARGGGPETIPLSTATDEEWGWEDEDMMGGGPNLELSGLSGNGRAGDEEKENDDLAMAIAMSLSDAKDGGGEEGAKGGGRTAATAAATARSVPKSNLGASVTTIKTSNRKLLPIRPSSNSSTYSSSGNSNSSSTFGKKRAPASVEAMPKPGPTLPPSSAAAGGDSIEDLLGQMGGNGGPVITSFGAQKPKSVSRPKTTAKEKEGSSDDDIFASMGLSSFQSSKPTAASGVPPRPPAPRSGGWQAPARSQPPKMGFGAAAPPKSAPLPSLLADTFDDVDDDAGSWGDDGDLDDLLDD